MVDDYTLASSKVRIAAAAIAVLLTTAMFTGVIVGLTDVDLLNIAWASAEIRNGQSSNGA